MIRGSRLDLDRDGHAGAGWRGCDNELVALAPSGAKKS